MNLVETQQAGGRARRARLMQLYCGHAALRMQVALLRLELAYDLAVRAAFNPNQPRIPAGRPDGGQWTDGDGGVIPVADSDRPGNGQYLNPHILRDHVDKSDAELVARIQRLTVRRRFISSFMDRNGTFVSKESARDLIKRTLDFNPEATGRVASGDLPHAFLTHRFGFVTGREAYRSPSASERFRFRKTYMVGVRIVHEPRFKVGYRATTAYPRNYNPGSGR